MATEPEASDGFCAASPTLPMLNPKITGRSEIGARPARRAAHRAVLRASAHEAFVPVRGAAYRVVVG